MLNRVWALAAVVWLAAASASAQPAKPDTAVASAAAASAAMERARRQAAGPMRFILEASRPRRKFTEAEAAAPSDAANVRSVAGRSSPLAPPAPAPALAAAAAAADAAPGPVPPVPAPPSPALADSAAQAPAQSAATESTLNSELLQVKTASPVPDLQNIGQAPLTAPLSSGPMALPAISAGPVRPKLVSQVDPEVPQRVLDELGRNARVLIDITIRVDGSVAAVALAGPAPRQLLRVVQAAVEQWRFEPLPSERVHRVELLFNPEP